MSESILVKQSSSEVYKVTYISRKMLMHELSIKPHQHQVSNVNDENINSSPKLHRIQTINISAPIKKTLKNIVPTPVNISNYKGHINKYSAHWCFKWKCLLIFHRVCFLRSEKLQMLDGQHMSKCRTATEQSQTMITNRTGLLKNSTLRHNI